MSDNELDSLFGDSDFIPKGDFQPGDYTFNLKPRGNGVFREKYRPQTFEEIVPTCSVEQLRNQVDNPSASQIFLMEGRSGTGKTTCARVLARALICKEENSYNKPCLQCRNCKRFDKSFDVLQLNTADKNKVDNIRDLVVDMKTLPANFPKKVYILDEVQRLTKEAQQVLLTELEEPPSHILVFLCTTDSIKLNKALVDRTCRITFKSVTTQQALDVINQVLHHEKLEANDDIKEALFARSGGSIRKLLNNIQAYSEGGFDPKEEEEDETTAEVKALFNAIVKADWPELSKLLKKPNVKKDCESLRIGLENYFRAVTLNKGNLKEAAQMGNALVRLTGSLIEGDTTTTTMYNHFILKCLRACAVFQK